MCYRQRCEDYDFGADIRLLVSEVEEPSILSLRIGHTRSSPRAGKALRQRIQQTTRKSHNLSR